MSTSRKCKLVIAGSASLVDGARYWKGYWEGQGYEILDWPAPIPSHELERDYPRVYTEFFLHLLEADTVFVMNETRHGMIGHIGAETFAELGFAVAHNCLDGRNRDIVLLQMPAEQVACFSEVRLWLSLGWLRLFSSP